MSIAAELPTDVAALQALVRGLMAERDEVVAEHDRSKAELQRLYLVIKELQRHRFGRRSEKSGPDGQLALALEDTEQEIAAAQGAMEEAEARRTRRERPQRSPKRLNRGSLPPELPRIERLLDMADKTCACCGGALHCIGEDVTERLDMVPATFRVEVTRRPKYACRTCKQGVVQTPAPERVVDSGLPTEALVAQVLVAKYADHLPLYRQAQMWARQGVIIDRSTLADWVGRAAFHLKPVWERLRQIVVGSPVIFADETRAPVLDPGRGRTKKGQLWTYARDGRSWGGDAPPAVAYVYEPDRSAARPAAHLASFAGVLQVDGYAAYQALAGPTVHLAFCWSHVRRKFWDIQVAGHAPIAAEAVQRINALFAIERRIAGRSPEERVAVRQAEAAPLVADLRSWLEQRRAAVSRSSGIANAIDYALGRWDGLVRFLGDGRVELSTNTVERAIRPLALTRKNSLFAGSDGGAAHWACIASLIETCKLNGIDPQAWLAWVLDRLLDGHPKARIDELMPWAFRPSAP